eukprot:11033805-Alexandrium_andersonii.AAC.1
MEGCENLWSCILALRTPAAAALAVPALRGLLRGPGNGGAASVLGAAAAAGVGARGGARGAGAPRSASTVQGLLACSAAVLRTRARAFARRCTAASAVR